MPTVVHNCVPISVHNFKAMSFFKVSRTKPFLFVHSFYLFCFKEMGFCLSHCSVIVKRYYDRGSFYGRRHLIGNLLELGREHGG